MYITIAVCGFQHEVWQKQFFPDDLPKDWYFNYYSNEFNAVLLSADEQVSFGNEALKGMLEDADSDFIFVLEDCDEARQLYSQECESDIFLVNSLFSPITANQLCETVSVEQAEIVLSKKTNKNIDNTACVLRVTSTAPVSNENIKHILQYIQTNFKEYHQVCLFLGHCMQDVNTINAAKIINDLL